MTDKPTIDLARDDLLTVFDTNFQINPHDVAVMMCLLKIARLKQGSRTEDTYLDASAYMAIAREIGERVVYNVPTDLIMEWYKDAMHTLDTSTRRKN